MDSDDVTFGRALGLERYTRHVLLCTGPNCCTSTRGLETWGYLKSRLAELQRGGRLARFGVYKTQVSCFKVCRNGPILVVYPEGVWYSGVDTKVCEAIISQHLLRGEIVESHVFAQNPHMGQPAGDDPPGGDAP